jgi:hypothetical protein
MGVPAFRLAIHWVRPWSSGEAFGSSFCSRTEICLATTTLRISGASERVKIARLWTARPLLYGGHRAGVQENGEREGTPREHLLHAFSHLARNGFPPNNSLGPDAALI